MKNTKKAKELQKRLNGGVCPNYTLPGAEQQSLVREIIAWLNEQGLGVCLSWEYDDEERCFVTSFETVLTCNGPFERLHIKRSFSFQPFNPYWEDELKAISSEIEKINKILEKNWELVQC